MGSDRCAGDGERERRVGAGDGPDGAYVVVRSAERLACGAGGGDLREGAQFGPGGSVGAVLDGDVQGGGGARRGGDDEGEPQGGVLAGRPGAAVAGGGARPGGGEGDRFAVDRLVVRSEGRHGQLPGVWLWWGPVPAVGGLPGPDEGCGQPFGLPLSFLASAGLPSAGLAFAGSAAASFLASAFAGSSGLAGSGRGGSSPPPGRSPRR